MREQGSLFQPDVPATAAVARRSDPETSHEAAASIDNLTDRQLQVLGVLARDGVLDDAQIMECARARGIRQSPSGFRTRRKELVDQGLVEFTGAWRVPEGSDRRCRIWGITDAGRTLLRAPRAERMFGRDGRLVRR